MLLDRGSPLGIEKKISMPGNALFIHRLISGGLITNYLCTSVCRHCLYRSSPRWAKDFISSEVTRKNLETIRRLGVTLIHIGGGEPLLNPQCVASVLRIAREVGVDIEYLETNASWYRDRASALAILEKLSAEGLTTLLLSISPFHNEHTPLVKIEGVIKACLEIGISIFPWAAEFISDLRAFDPSRPHPLEEYERHFGRGYIADLPRRYWVSPGGRALETFSPYRPPRPVSEIIRDASGCRELAEVSHFHMDLYGNYIPGLCSGLSIFRDDLGRPLPREEYPVLTRLFAEGLGSLVSYVSSTYGFRPSRSAYGLKCELCYEIRRYLVVEKDVNSKELQPQGHYLYG